MLDGAWSMARRGCILSTRVAWNRSLTRHLRGVEQQVQDDLKRRRTGAWTAWRGCSNFETVTIDVKVRLQLATLVSDPSNVSQMWQTPCVVIAWSSSAELCGCLYSPI